MCSLLPRGDPSFGTGSHGDGAADHHHRCSRLPGNRLERENGFLVQPETPTRFTGP
jgi:hypothetical protein